MIWAVLRNAEDESAVSHTVQSLAELTSFAPNCITVLTTGADIGSDTNVSSRTVKTEELDSFLANAVVDDDWVMFLDAGTRYSPGAFDRLIAAEIPVGIECLVHREGAYEYRLNWRLKVGETYRVEDDSVSVLWAGSTPTLVRGRRFRQLSDRARSGEAPDLLFAEAVLGAGSFSVLGGAVISAKHLEDRWYGERHLFDLDWYFRLLNEWGRLFDTVARANGAVPVFGQRLFLYHLIGRLVPNVKQQNKFVLTGRDLERFEHEASVLLRRIGLEQILALRSRPVRLPRNLLPYVLRLKLGHDTAPQLVLNNGELQAVVGGTTVEKLSGVRIRVEVLDREGNDLILSGWMSSTYLADAVSLNVVAGAHRWPVTDNGISSDYSVFGRVSHRSLTFRVRLPLSELAQATTVAFVASVAGGTDQELGLDFTRTSAKLSTSPGSYWRVGPVLLHPERASIRVRRATVLRRFIAEAHREVALLRSRDRVHRAAALLRLLYFVTRPYFARQRHWLYYDRVIVAGDNGEYAYRYASCEADGVKKHYVLKPGVADALRFEREGLRYLAHKSLRHRLTFLNTEIVFATHVNPPIRNAFSWNEAHFRDLFSFRTVYINHGLVVDRLDYILNRSRANVDRVCVVSAMETANLLRPSYGYAPEQIVETGFARYDGLANAPRREILLAPTWRTYLNPPQHADESGERNREFLDSPYFQVYNELINHPRLADALEQHDYRLVYLLHPATRSQARDFTSQSPRVQVLASGPESAYEVRLNEADLMITDYSGVQFDFAHMMKPVLYFQHADIPPHYEQTTFDYRVHGFGEVATDVERLIDLLIEHMRGDGAMSQHFQDRVHAFFTHVDAMNSQRIYEVGASLATARRDDMAPVVEQS